MAKPVILYWYIDRPTDDDRAKAAAVGAKLRNVSAYKPGDCIEVCDKVMGYAPAAYVEQFGRLYEQNPAPIASAAASSSDAQQPAGIAFCVHIGGGQWEITDRNGVKSPLTYARSTAYAKVRAMNGES